MKLLTFVLLLLFGSAFAAPINRIVSLAPSLTMNVYYLDSKDKLVGVTSYCEIAKPDKKEIIGSAITVNVEKIMSLKPDLVLATGLTKPETIEMLRKVGLRVEVFATPKSFNEICVHFLRLGTMIGKEAKAKEVIAESKNVVDKIKAQWAKAPGQKVFFQIGAKPLFTVLTGTFMNDYILFCNGTNVAAELKAGTIGRESVLQRNPDVIIIITMGVVGDDEKATWEKFSQLSAAKRKKIFIIDSNLACTPTPRSFAQTLEIINDKLRNTKE